MRFAINVVDARVARPETLEHALKCLARLINLILGPGAAAPKKLQCGASLVVLGVEITLSSKGFQFRPAAAKAQKWKDSPSFLHS